VNRKEESRVKSQDLVIVKGNFRDLGEIAREEGFDRVNGVLFDLGVSSHQLETRERGFSFNNDSGLDMRMDRSIGATAADLVNVGAESELANLFWKYGEEMGSRRIAKAIVEVRKIKPIETTDELANLILRVSKHSSNDRTHPATRVFQALRIAVNSELESLEEALPQAVDLLESRGRLLVVTFHSLEDRIVKNFIKDNQAILESITDKPISADDEEVRSNPRSRSGKLRVAQKR
jgi:16S rRNA (cytosine1402-N4)-methyltransferase